MENQIIYGVFAIDIELPEKTNKKQELVDLAEAMQSVSYTKQQQARFCRAYKRLEDAVTECYNANGCHIDRILETSDGVNNGKTQTLYFPRIIEVEQ